MGSSKAGYSTHPWPTERSSRMSRRAAEATDGAEGPRPWCKEEKQGQGRVGARSSWSQRAAPEHGLVGRSKACGAARSFLMRGEKGDGRAAPGGARAPDKKDERVGGDPGAGLAGPLEEEWMRETAVPSGG